MTGFASKRQAAWDKFANDWEGIEGWGSHLVDAAIETMRESFATKGSATAIAMPPKPVDKLQEPVGEVNRHGRDSHGRQWHGIHWYDANIDVPHGTKLYTAQQPQNFCSRCGKRTPDLTTIHTCTPPRGLEMT